jgi:membrane protease YdiL (CAAX protease family)
MTANTTIRARLRWIFVGSQGIRAGWSVLIFLFVIGLPAGLLGLALHHYHIKPKPSNTLAPWLLLMSEAVTIAFIAGATAVMAWIERRSLWSYGLDRHRLLPNAAAGWMGGFLSLSLLVMIMAGGGFLVFDGLALHGVSILSNGLIWLLGFILVGIAEETLFRGYVLATLSRGMGFWPAAVLTSVLFGLAHMPNKGETALGLIAVVAAGLSLCLLLRVTGSLWMSIGYHAAWDWAQSYLYGTPDSGMLARGHLLASHAAGNVAFSGGIDGPEGSLLAAPVMIAGLLAMVWLTRRPSGLRRAVGISAAE